MKTWFKKLSIQNRLFMVFGVIILTCTLAVGFNLFNTVQVGAQSEVLDRLFGKVREFYQAQDLLQKMDLAEKSFVAQGYDSYLDDFDNYSAQIEAFIRQALIEADQPREKNALIALQETLQTHADNFRAIIPAVYEEDWDAVNEQQGTLFTEIDDLNDKVNAILEESYTTFDDMDTWQTLTQFGAVLASAIALVVFVILAFIAAIVLSSQVNRPIRRLTEAVAAIEARQFDPTTVQKYAGRQEEIGQLARAFVDMAAAIQKREQTLRQQADEIRAKIAQREENLQSLLREADSEA